MGGTVPEVRDGHGEEGTEVVLLKFGDELGKRGDERRLRLEFISAWRCKQAELSVVCLVAVLSLPFFYQHGSCLVIERKRGPRRIRRASSTMNLLPCGPHRLHPP
jgi:hypothetical protein